MSLPSRNIPTVAPATAVSFTVISGGTDLGPNLPVLSLVVDREVNRIPTATLMLQDGSLADQTFKLSESGSFDPGQEIELHFGYQGTDLPIFKGVIVGQRIRLQGDRTLLVVNCKDAAFRMTVNRRTRYFEDASDADALETLLREAELEDDVANTGEVVPELTQHLCTDWDFVVSRAEANGMVVLVKDGKVTINKPELAPTPALKLEYGANLTAFDLEVDARQQYREVESHAWRPADDETVTETNAPGAPAPGDYSTAALADVHHTDPQQQVHGAGVEPAELIAWSDATARFSAVSRVRATLSFQGTGEVSVGDTVTLDKLGAVYNGPAYVSGLRHELTAGSWTTTAQLGLRPERFTERFAVSAPPAGGLLPATSGLHIATVVRVHDDPLGEERIQITLPATAPKGAGNWARLANGLGGNNLGLTFRPEVDDEVVVGFLHEDPRFPVILGGLHSSARPAPFPPTEENEETGYVSRGGHRLTFHDGEESIMIETPGGDKLHLLGKDGKVLLADANGNQLEMSAQGITLESAGDLTLKASGKILIDGSTVDIKSASTGKFEAGATLDLKGSLIQIN
ncbi:type VI secretion system tip protein VgrG [Neolewinella litorea]|uniref:Type VI secretion system tip protein VgrG n=1 Tax=Neolewinella litorea TaxID=2562452 RepID=A0A4S4NI90_9BACT|nr:type VI secretion system tip protein VgrG [Neolewinella litorea]THH39409.1 type VI secretion system tip protein VgrG [Neolewinella litorea]